MTFKSIQTSYTTKLAEALKMPVLETVESLCISLLRAWNQKQSIYLCGNGGSAGNAIHLANDFIYGAGARFGGGLRVEALSANPAVLTCLANDIGYEFIFSQQLKVKANPGDVLIALSGSGNSPNIVRAIETANELGMETFAILGYSGGKCKALAKCPLHFEIDDMQIAEDMQLIVGHICMQWLATQTPDRFIQEISNE